ncbi:MAG: hypothetical protein ACYDCC_04850 [Actinomycetota bacterium]
MTTRIDLPSGGWADFRDPTAIKYGERRKIEKVNARIGVTARRGSDEVSIDADSIAEAMLHAREVAIEVLVESWSFDMPIPAANAGWVNEISAHDFDALNKAGEKALEAMFLNVEVDPSPQSPTAPSVA